MFAKPSEIAEWRLLMRGREQLSGNSCSGLVFGLSSPCADPDSKVISPWGGCVLRYSHQNPSSPPTSSSGFHPSPESWGCWGWRLLCRLHQTNPQLQEVTLSLGNEGTAEEDAFLKPQITGGSGAKLPTHLVAAGPSAPKLSPARGPCPCEDGATTPWLWCRQFCTS